MTEYDKTQFEPENLEEIILKIKLLAFDFDGVFTDNKVYVFQDGTEAVMCSRGDGIGLHALKKRGIDTIVISTETNPVVSARCRKLKIRCVQGCKDKLSELKKIAVELNCSLHEIAFMGNDVNDLTCLSAVALPIVTNDAHPDVITSSKYRTRIKGGHGAVREICDLFCSVLDGIAASKY